MRLLAHLLSIIYYKKVLSYDRVEFEQYFSTIYGLHSFSASNIIAITRSECLQVGAVRLSFTLEDVGIHSLSSGGSYLNNVLERTLMSVGRWRPLGFMVYIYS